MSNQWVMPPNHLILCHPLLLLPSIFPHQGSFLSDSVLHITWPKYWSFSFSISPSNEYSGLISFRMDWFDLLAVQGTSPTPQFKSINSWALLHPYMTTGKTIALTRQTFGFHSDMLNMYIVAKSWLQYLKHLKIEQNQNGSHLTLYWNSKALEALTHVAALLRTNLHHSSIKQCRFYLFL